MERIRKNGSRTFSNLSDAVRKGIEPEMCRYKAMQGEIQRTVGVTQRRAAVAASKAILEFAADDHAVSSQQQRQIEQMPPTVPKTVAPVGHNYEEILKQKQMEIKTMRQHWQEETERLNERKLGLERVEKDLLAKISHLEMATRDISSAIGTVKTRWKACVQCKHCGTWIQGRSQLVQHNHPLEQESSSSSSESEESLDPLPQPPHTAVQYTPTPHQSRHQALSCHDRHQRNKEGNNKLERSNDQLQSDTAHSDGPARALSPLRNMSVLISSRRASEIPETILNYSDEIAQAHASASSFSASHRHIVSTPGRFDRGYSRQPAPFNSDGNRYPPGTNQIYRRDGHLVKASDMKTGQDSGPCSRCRENTTARRIRKNIQRDAVSADTTPTKQRMDMGAHQRDLPALASDQMSRLAADSIPSGYVAGAAAAHVKTPERPLLAPPENLSYMGWLGR
ncbi:uncharacterized protein PAC_14945 [Phialocephala subalpina]|uniref:Uncharacterized protein n=1 Tax=Phialocephala subalpina TaxID=576137 RepID=A0A1L7XJ24_9HELO|nr:uncharacterized protein PAC_14945 [Phialocephala subalpina]